MNMQRFHCPTKDKIVIVSRTQKEATTLEDSGSVFISGRLNCSDNDYQCTDDNCPLRKK